VKLRRVKSSQMRVARPGVLSKLLAAGLAGAIVCALSGCSYLAWKRARAAARAELEKNPADLALARDYAPQDCFGLVGQIVVPTHPHALLAAAFSHRQPTDLVGWSSVDRTRGYFAIMLPAGKYDLLFFTDRNDDGVYLTDEVIGRTPPDTPVRVDATTAVDGVAVPAPEVAIDPERPTSAPIAVRVNVNHQPSVVHSVDDPIFSPELGEVGVYQPSRFLARTQRWLFSVGQPDFSKPQIVLVHGIDGTPRDFRSVVASIDESRYSVWLFYYPSGLSLDQLGMALAYAVQRLVDGSGVPGVRVAIVAHSMGGLVGRRAVNQLCRDGRPAYLKMYASFDTPYGGVESAAGAVRRGTELVPSWIDVAAGSPFLTRLHARPLPDDLPFYLFFGWGDRKSSGPGPAGDGTITLASQLDPRAQSAATAMSGFGATHVGILSDPQAVAALTRALDDETAGKP
jgi:pimeloyl-ACP methyl ester carboxylesterase